MQNFVGNLAREHWILGVCGSCVMLCDEEMLTFGWMSKLFWTYLYIYKKKVFSTTTFSHKNTLILFLELRTESSETLYVCYRADKSVKK